MLIDATIADQAITYPTDLKLLNESREIAEGIIDELYEKTERTSKPRTYREAARRAYLDAAKKKQIGRKQLRKAIKKQLQYLRRDIKHIESLLDELSETLQNKSLNEVLKMNFPLNGKRQKQYHVIQQVYSQQDEMYRDNKKKVANRIVNIHQPHVRPMLRGKAGKKVEFGAKLGVSVTEEGIACVDTLSWENYNEGTDLEKQLENYKARHGHYPEKVLADKIYGTRKNRKTLKEKGVKFGGKSLGRPKKKTAENKEELKQEKKEQQEDARKRNPVEGKFGQGKQGYGLNKILARTAKTSESWVRCIFLVMNLLVLLKVFILFLINSLSYGFIAKQLRKFINYAKPIIDNNSYYQQWAL
jgi:hypothetical protein